MSVVIPPTIGRVVHLYNRKETFGGNVLIEGPHAAMITRVLTDALVNVVAFTAEGESTGLVGIPLRQDGEIPPDGEFWVEWMPFQKGQAARQEAAGTRVTA